MTAGDTLERRHAHFELNPEVLKKEWLGGGDAHHTTRPLEVEMVLPSIVLSWM